MSTEYEKLHESIEKSERVIQHKIKLHEQLREAKNDPEELKRLKFIIDGEDTPRQQAEAITEGNSKPHHIGEYTPLVLTQELVSLGQTNLAFRDKDWMKRAQDIKAVIQRDMKKDPRRYQGLLSKIDSIIQGEL